MNKSSTISNITMISLFVMVAVAVLSFHTVAAYPPCLPCPDGICGNVEDCRHGVVRDYCNRPICARAPDEECGGPFNIRGTCGGGLTCSRRCGRCVGCSTFTMECSRLDESECNK